MELTILFFILVFFSASLCDEWRIRIGVENLDGSLLDLYNYFGVCPEADDRHGTEDLTNIGSPEPHFLDLYFPHDDSARPDYWEPPFNSKYAVDIRNDSTEVHNFYFDVYSTSVRTESVAIFWVETDSVPPSYRVEISQIHEDGVNIFTSDTIWQLMAPGVHYFLAHTNKNAYNRLLIKPSPVFLRIGETAHLTAFLVGETDTLCVSSQWEASGEAVSLSGDEITGISDGVANVIGCFRGWCDTMSAIVYGTGILVQIHLRPGWNLISLPVAPTTPNPATVFGSEMYSNMYRFNSESREYEHPETIAAGEGFFILSLTDTIISIVGEPIIRIEKELPAGWHIIGCPAGYVIANSVEVSPPDAIIQHFFAYKGEQYLATDTLKAGNGYWMLLVDSAEISIFP